ncbi:predicted protein [Nematostella vectensis]|uniref:Growth arrest and DNA damage-inducible protein GADD45 alpha n=1 Tax=Nematostella vectensis TaxID=45351 RepID=A7T0U1_NEMVE|nr:predicted protein [Nematostella vectensis]|eukprot:XP_001622522.1 predicted protein [Nematostella vectensis]
MLDDIGEFEPFDEPMGKVLMQSKVLQLCLEDVLNSARECNELIMTTHGAAEQLEMDPDDVTLCVLVENRHADPGIQVHCRLIEAFCWEYPIPVVKVDSSRKLKTIAGFSQESTEPVHCLLVKTIEDSRNSLKTLLKFSLDRCPLIQLT